jgi:catechol 2,3-dioxygenase-like lactoylglutathione lyase family enzyme
VSIGVTRVFHLNVNCGDLERSLGFYRDLLGLSQGAHTVSPEQDGAAFGLGRVAWDAWIMLDERGYDGVVVDLLEWKTPRPSGAPPAAAHHVGFGRLGVVAPDVDDMYHRMQHAGVRCLCEPHDIEIPGVAPIRAFVCADPDGTLVEVISSPQRRFAFLIVNCADLDRSVEFYTEVLGFSAQARFSLGPQDGAALGIDGVVESEMAHLDDPRGDGSFALDLTQWKVPGVEGSPSREANRLGPFRLALYTDDIDASYDALLAAGAHCWSPPADLEMGPGIPPLRALLFDDPDGTVLELIQPPT